ncbi:MAG TPA: alcohol dehydrogenase catalytic domain-containing protein [Caldilineaceae bacterium]|nr:alcohol dehydrogenase catalytic domain-containing protein [Caldilineaceae bacterium]
MISVVAEGTMRAAFLYGPNDVRVDEVATPVLERPDDVLIRIAYTGICGSELHAIEGYQLVPGPNHQRPARSQLGHEYSGVVEAIGPEVGTARVGQRVTVAPRGPCHQCELCRNGMSTLCRKVTQRGGSWAEWIVAPAKLVHPLPDDVPLKIGALTEPLSAALRIVDRANLLAGMNVSVIGAGPIGLFAALLAYHAGASKVIVSDVRPSRLALAQRMGIPVVVNPRQEDLYTVVMDHTAGRGVEVSIEAVGLEPALSESIRLVAIGGTVVWGGLAPVELTLPISPNDMFMREYTLRTAWGGIEIFERTIRMEQRIDWSPMTEEIFPLAEAAAAVTYARTSAAGKVLLQVQPE